MPWTRHPTPTSSLHGFGPKALRILREGSPGREYSPPGTCARRVLYLDAAREVTPTAWHSGRAYAPVMPEGHTLFALARDLHEAFAHTTPEVTSPQGKFAEGAAELNGRELLRATSGASTSSSSSPTTAGCTCTSASSAASPSTQHEWTAEVPAVGAGAAAAAHRPARRRPARPQPLRGRHPGAGRRRARPPRPRPAAPRRRSRRGVGAHLEVVALGRRAAHGPVGARGRRQRLPLRGALPAPPLPLHRGPQAAGGPRGG